MLCQFPCMLIERSGTLLAPRASINCTSGTPGLEALYSMIPTHTSLRVDSRSCTSGHKGLPLEMQSIKARSPEHKGFHVNVILNAVHRSLDLRA